MTALATLTPVLRVLHLFVTLAMIGVVLIQRSEGGGLGIGSTQGMGAFMSGRGTANLLTRTTAILAALFFTISLSLALLNKGTNGAGRDILAPTPSATAPALHTPALHTPALHNAARLAHAGQAGPRTEPQGSAEVSLLASASTPTDTDVAIIGAGVAGLAAASTLRAAGLRVELLEAAPHIGGRAYTTVMAGHNFDHGAQWLHAAHRNPLVGLAQAAGLDVHADRPWDDRMHVFDPASPQADLAAYGAAEQAWEKAVTERLGDGPDCSLAAAAAPVARDPWTATIESWEGAIIAAADATELSLADWHANALDGENFVSPLGIGGLVARLFPTPVRLNTRVTAIAAESHGVRVSTDAGGFTAGAAIVTVSTGVLRAGHIAFAPVLPPEVVAALDGLPMGLLSKIVLQAATDDRLGLAPDSGVFRRLDRRGAPFLSTAFWPGEAPFATGYVGGAAAWSFAHSRAEAGAFMRAELAATLNRQVADAFTAETFMTGWGADPLHLGAYAYARPGQAGARAALARPWWERVHYAGEAVAPDGLCGTVAGAYLAGVAAAERVKEGLLF